MKKLFFYLLLLITGPITAQSVNVNSPDSGEVWNTGTQEFISWTTQSVTSVDVDYSTDNGLTWTNILTNYTTSGTKNYPWTVGGPASFTCRIRVEDYADTTIESISPVFIIGPLATLSITSTSLTNSSANTTCAGTALQLSANATFYSNPGGGPPPPPPGFLYQWSPGGSLSDSTVSNPIANPTVTTIYSVTVDNQQGQTVTGSDTILVNPAPNLTITATNDTANVDRMDTLYASVGNGQSASYQWFYDGYPSFIGNDLPYNYPGLFECVATNNYGCTDTAVQYIVGTLNVSITSVTNNHCGNDSTGAINVSVSGGTGSYMYYWSNGDTTQNISNLPGGFYILVVYDTDGSEGAVSQVISGDSMSVYIIDENFSYSGAPDSLEAFVTGGVAPYSYVWSNGNPGLPGNLDIVPAVSGMYSCTVTDEAGCTATALTGIGITLQNDTVTLPENQTFTLGFTFGNPSISVLSAVSGPVHGATSVYDNYLLIYTPNTNFTGTDSFTYSVCLVDSQTAFIGYCDTATVYLNFIDTVVISLNSSPPACPGSCNGSIYMADITGATPYVFLWNTGDTTQNLQDLCPGLYTVTVTDANHTSSTASAVLDSSTTTLTLTGYVDTLVAIATYNGSTWVYNWSTGVTDTSANNASYIVISQSGYYCVTATNVLNGCSLTDCTGAGCPGCVWPGDANNDGIVNNLDLLAIGLGYDSTGPARINPTINWVGQQCADWADTLLGGSNYKFIDCNGDGMINANDTLAIVQNFELSHLRGGGIITPRQGIPELGITLNPDTAGSGETIVATLTLGSSALPANNVYGLAFTFNYDPILVDSTKTAISIGSSWLGDQTDRIYIAPDFKELGQIQFAITRIDHVTRSGNGPIGTVTFVITTDNINGRRSLYSYLSTQYWISDLTAIDNNGNLLDINEGVDTAIIAYTTAGINEIPNNGAGIKIYPNPANEQLTVENDPSLAVNEIKITDLLGNFILSQQPGNSNHTVIDISSLSSGAYFVEVITGTGNIVKRFVITK